MAPNFAQRQKQTIRRKRKATGSASKSRESLSWSALDRGSFWQYLTLVAEHLTTDKKRCKLSSSCDQFRGLSLDDSTRFAVSRGRGRKAAKSAKLNERAICCRLLVHASLLSRPRPFGGARQETVRRSPRDVARAFPCNRKYCMPKARFRFHPCSGGDRGHPAPLVRSKNCSQ